MNEPGIGPKSGKVWGITQLVFSYNDTEGHIIFVNKGGYCSNHSHASKWNRFHVIEGELIITQFSEEDGAIEDSTILGPGETTDVGPGIRHKFEATKDTIAIEFYWVPLDPEDIDRHGTEGGKN